MIGRGWFSRSDFPGPVVYGMRVCRVGSSSGSFFHVSFLPRSAACKLMQITLPIGLIPLFLLGTAANSVFAAGAPNTRLTFRTMGFGYSGCIKLRFRALGTVSGWNFKLRQRFCLKPLNPKPKLHADLLHQYLQLLPRGIGHGRRLGSFRV